VATVDGTGSTWTNTARLQVGFDGAGTLSITHGGKVSNTYGQVGYYVPSAAGIAAIVNVDGVGSTWTSSQQLAVCSGANGGLNITNGGTVSSFDADLFGSPSATIAVNGAGSTWQNSWEINVGDTEGYGTVKITNAGSISTDSVSINPGSLLVMDVGGGSKLKVAGTAGPFNNNGTVRLAASAADAVGAYTPIAYSGAWSGSGTVQALGGTWNAANHTFTVSSAKTGTAGQGVTVDLSNTQRTIVIDPSSGLAVGAGFQPTATSSNVTFTASSITGQNLDALGNLVRPCEALVADWQLGASGAYTVGNPVYLSMQVGSGYSADDLDVWQFNGTTWSTYTTTDLSYDGSYANFTVTGFGDYAVVTVPEPATLMLLACGAVVILRRRRRD
jgi:T5SS/PEP-CTERM-associated repeat protein